MTVCLLTPSIIFIQPTSSQDNRNVAGVGPLPPAVVAAAADAIGGVDRKDLNDEDREEERAINNDTYG